MVKFKANQADGRPIVGLGLTEENIRRLQSDQPIYIKSEDLGMKGFDIMIFSGKTEKTMEADLRPFMGRNTKRT